jgi:hypothetical protein
MGFFSLGFTRKKADAGNDADLIRRLKKTLE